LVASEGKIDATPDCLVCPLLLIYLLLGLTLRSLLLANKGASWAPWIWNLLPAHLEFSLLGWMAQLAMGVATGSVILLMLSQIDLRSSLI
jgi:hypothetical protein